MNISRSSRVVLTILILGLCALVGTSEATDYYVRAGAAGANNGTNWSDAWSSLGGVAWGSGVGQVGAGDTLWIAGGSYSSFSVEGSGTASQRIYIKRARAANTECTSATGWQPGYDSQVVINGGIRFAIHGLQYVTIDGQVRKGMKIEFPNEGVGVNISKKADYIQLINLEIVGPAGDSSDGYTETKSTRGINAVCYENWSTGVWHYEPVYNLHVKNCDIHGSSTLIYLHTVHNLIVEGCNLYDSRYDPSVAGAAAVHSNILYSQKSNNGIFRNNKVWNMEAEGVFFTYDGQTGWKLYGNMFRDSVAYGRAIETRTGYTHGTFEVYNNTFVNLWGGVKFNGTVSKGITRNNLFYNVTSNDLGSHDYNASNVGLGEAHDQIINSSIFANYPGKDFQLISGTSPGDSTIGTEYSKDMLGTFRGADGTWDRGAFEYKDGGSGSDATRPSPPISLLVY